MQRPFSQEKGFCLAPRHFSFSKKLSLTFSFEPRKSNKKNSQPSSCDEKFSVYSLNLLTPLRHRMSKFLTFVNFNFYRRRRKAELKYKVQELFLRYLIRLTVDIAFDTIEHSYGRVVWLRQIWRSQTESSYNLMFILCIMFMFCRVKKTRIFI